MSTDKVRVYQVAREMGLDYAELERTLASLGIAVRNHMSTLDRLDVERIKRALERSRHENVVEERIRPTVVRRRLVGKTDVATGPQVPAAVTAADTAPRPPVSPPAREGTGAPPRAPTSGSAVAPTASAPAEERRETLGRSVAAVAPPPPAPPAAPPMVRDDAPAAPRTQATPVAASAPPSGSVAVASPGAASAEAAPVATSAPAGVGMVGVRSAAAGSLRLSPEEARARVLAELRPSEAGPRRREIARAALGPAGRQPVSRPGKRKIVPGKKSLKTEITVPSAQKRVIRIEDQIQLQTLAQRMSLKATDVLMKLMQMGMSGVHINSTLDADTAKLLASEFGYDVENIARTADELVAEARGQFVDAESDRQVRPPIVTVMGHVDHGKTSLLDRIRKSDVAAHEAGGITQHIGAYRVETPRGPIVFLDTPGHEAFTAMRARGAQVTDIVVLVVAADDGVMPQTREAINHARAAQVPIIVAVNKIDKPGARLEQIRQELTGLGLQPEEWGGDTIYVPCSALTGAGIDRLLDAILLVAEMLELRANPAIPAEGTVLEAYLDRGRGPVAHCLVTNGTLEPGHFIVAGSAWGRVRAMQDERGRPLRSAGAATPVEVLGLNEMPQVGDRFYVVTDARKAQEVAEAAAKSAGRGPTGARRSLEDVVQAMQSGEALEVRVIIKADVQGSVEALHKALGDLSTDKVKVNVIHTGVGGVTENDVMLARASNAFILGFNVRPAGQASALAKKESVEIRTYSIIYEAVDDVRKAMAGKLAPRLVTKELGKAEVRQIFHIARVGTVAGCYVTEGKIVRTARVRLVRDSVVVWEGRLGSLRRFKEDVREVAAGYECGLSLDGYQDVKERDVIECFEIEEVAPSLEEAG
ncbi:MAG: translation initiation factor IF-2 [Myxococcota bacterium]|nr:translation initiation factor IF-2 [Myxococcota bacterium]MDW8363004.1 translation initiation factor IF-2 [Myxococcales bacterium]